MERRELVGRTKGIGCDPLDWFAGRDPPEAPDTPPAYGPFHRLAYDSMGRLAGLKDFNNADIVNNVTYGPAGQLLTVSWMSYTETRQYNNLLQMTRLTATGGSQGSLDLEYKFSSNQNNGRITAMKDWVTGEEVQYTYDTQRLTRAETIGPEWGSTYGYDGFGNLLQKTPAKGSGVPLLNIAVDPWTNRVSGLSGGSCDANGNDLTAGAFDLANRLKQSGSTYFQHDAANKRVWKGTVAGGAITSEEFYFYAPWGAKLAAYKPTSYLNVATMTIVSSNEYFGGKLIKINGTAVLTDRLGSNVSNGKRYFPYGEERGSTANSIEKFGTYFRDAETGLDYADQRYYKGSWGRFVSVDPILPGSVARPDSWNFYAYADNDPVNNNDPSGLVTCGDLVVQGGAFDGLTVREVMTGTAGNDLFAQLIWHEGGTLFNEDLANTTAYVVDLIGIGSAILNQWDVDNGLIEVHDSAGRRALPIDGRQGNRSLGEVVTRIGIDGRGPVFTNGRMRDPERAQLIGILNTNLLAPPLVLDISGLLVNQACEGVFASIAVGSNLLGGGPRYSPNGLVLLYWNQAPANSTTTFPGSVGYIGWRGPRSRGHTFWGLYRKPRIEVPPELRQGRGGLNAAGRGPSSAGGRGQ